MPTTRGRGPVRIGPVASTRKGGVNRVSADVDGTNVWFESGDAELEPSPEAFASAFLLPALWQRRQLQMEEPLDPEWLGHLPELMGIWKGWWRLEPILPDAQPLARTGPRPAATAKALFFSGGVDSFHALLKTDASPDLLVTAQGMDVGLDDPVRWADVERMVREVATERGIGARALRTNVREHPLLRGIEWDNACGGVLAALGHVLEREVSQAVIASSVSHQEGDVPYGSHFRTDPLHSSSRVALRDVGMEFRRLQKLRQIAAEPIVQRHLRVCFANLAPTGNCSRCGKCLITRLVLVECGVLDAYEVFEGSASLVRDIDGLPRTRNLIRSLRTLSTDSRFDPELLRAIRDLVQRSAHVQSWPVRWRRAVLKKLLQWTGRIPG
jgi:hypothetical protein